MSGKSRNSKVHLFCDGKPCELPTTELNTHRELIEYYYFLSNVYNSYSNRKKAKLITSKLIEVWTSVNSNLPIISNLSVVNRVSKVLDTVKLINWNQAKIKQKNWLVLNLDKIFDISACVCNLDQVPCSDRRIHCKKSSCLETHLVCLCPPEQNVPMCDRAYLKDQRQRNRSKGHFQMSSLERIPKRKSLRRNKPVEKSLIHTVDHHTNPNLGELETTVNDEYPNDSCRLNGECNYINEKSRDFNWKPHRKPSDTYNLIKLQATAAEFVRGGVSSQAGASIVNSVLWDHRELLRDDVDINQIYVDKSKIDRAKQHAYQKWGLPLDQSDNITCVGLDGKIDNQTCEFEEIMINGQSYMKKATVPQHHLTFTNETEGKGTYLTHRNLPMKGATGVLMASKTLQVLEEYGSVESISAILVDNTSVNTGQENGVVHQLELLLGRKLHMIGCSLHQNELPFRALFKKLDGTSSGPNALSGVLGKLCMDEVSKHPVRRFKKIEIGFSEFNPNECFDDLSQDQLLLLHYVKGINSGTMDEHISCRKIGPVNHARWLTLAIRLLALYTRTLQPSSQLITLVSFIMKCYAPSWFSIKQRPFLKDSPRILHYTICYINSIQDPDIKIALRKSLQRNCFCLLPENMLYAMIMDEDKNVRKKGWQVIYDLKETKLPYGRKVPQVNWEAESWHQLVNFSALEAYNEPATVKRFPIETIRKLSITGEDVNLPIFPAHSQSLERSVKLVSEASKLKYGFEGRHSSILTKIASRSRRPEFTSKGYYSHTYDDNV